MLWALADLIDPVRNGPQLFHGLKFWPELIWSGVCGPRFGPKVFGISNYQIWTKLVSEPFTRTIQSLGPRYEPIHFGLQTGQNFWTKISEHLSSDQYSYLLWSAHLCS